MTDELLANEALEVRSTVGWKRLSLRDVATFASGTTPSRARQSEYFDGGTHPWVKTMDLNNSKVLDTDECVTELALRETSLKMNPAGSVLVAMYGGFHQIGRTGILTMDAAVNQAISVINPHPKDLLPRFLLYVLNFKIDYWKTVASSSRKDPNITSQDIRNFVLLAPGIPDQKAIVEALDDVNALISSLEALIAKKQGIKQGMMQALLTGKTRLPGFTAQWRDIRLGEHVNYVKTVALSRAQLDDESPRRYLHYGDIHTSTDIRLAAATADMPRAAAALLGSAGLLMVGDVVFADASEDPAGVGKSVEVTSVPAEGAVPGLHTIAARFNKKVFADGFKAYLQFIPEFRNSLLRLAAGTKVLATTRGYISSITLQLPDVDEQVAIARILHDADDEINALRLRLVKARAVKQGMMQELLTGRTRLQSVEALA